MMAYAVPLGLFLLVWVILALGVRCLSRVKVMIFAVGGLFVYEATLTALRVTGAETPQWPWAFGAAALTLGVSALLLRLDEKDPSWAPQGVTPSLQRFVERRPWREEFSGFFDAVHEVRCLLFPFKSIGWRGPFGPAAYCQSNEIESGCGIGKGRWWWAGHCCYHKCTLWEELLEATHDDRCGGAPMEHWRSDLTTLGSALDLAEKKSAALLAFNALMLSVITFAMRYEPLQVWNAPKSLRAWSVLWLLLWAWTTYLCVRNQSNVVWPDPKKGDHKLTREAWVGSLIGHVVSRNARLRVAVAGTFLLGILMTCIVGMTAWAWFHSHKPQPSPPLPAGVATFRIFFDPPGAVCVEGSPLQVAASNGTPSSSNAPPTTDAGFVSVIETLRRTGARTVRVVGSADILELSDRLRPTFGNNAGLALERAECVARRLQAQLIPLSKYIQVDVTVRAPEIKQKADPADRVVDVILLP